MVSTRWGWGDCLKTRRLGVQWYRTSAEQGDIAGQSRLGAAYLHGWGIPKDEAEGIRWLSKAAEEGDGGAAVTLGSHFFLGERIASSEEVHDESRVVTWIRTAAERGHFFAPFLLGYLYSSGQGGLDSDDVTSMHWYRIGAEQGHTRAQFSLGAGYAFGKGAPENPTEAYAWLSVTAAQGDASNGSWEKEARELMDFLRTSMTKGEIDEARELARQYWIDHVLSFREEESR